MDKGTARDVSPSQVALLLEAKGLGSKLAVIRKNLLLPRETMALMYPAPANSRRIYLYYPARLKEMLVRHGSTLWRLARGDTKTQAAAAHAIQVSELENWLLSG